MKGRIQLSALLKVEVMHKERLVCIKKSGLMISNLYNKKQYETLTTHNFLCVGFAAFDKSTSTFIISQYIDDLTYPRTVNKIEYFEPSEVVMLKKNNYVKNDLKSVLSKQFKNLSK